MMILTGTRPDITGATLFVAFGTTVYRYNTEDGNTYPVTEHVSPTLRLQWAFDTMDAAEAFVMAMYDDDFATVRDDQTFRTWTIQEFAPIPF